MAKESVEALNVYLKDYLQPGGRWPYESLNADLAQYQRDRRKFVLVSVPGHLIGTNYPDDDTGYPFSDMAGTFYRTANDLLSDQNGQTFD